MGDTINTITADSVGRILAVMKPYIDAARLGGIDRQILLREIQRCALTYSVRKYGGGIRLKEKNLKKLSRLKSVLRDICNDPATPWRVLGDNASGMLKSEKVIQDLDSVLACKSTPPLQANPIELLVGQDLPFIFKGFFGSGAGRSRSDDQTLLPGPYLDFTQAVLSEMGISYSNESISRALTDRGRRRPR
ncbi:MAG: hypothetical protein WA728_17840 [Xanthobacteraceae bacterium]